MKTIVIYLVVFVLMIGVVSSIDYGRFNATTTNDWISMNLTAGYVYNVSVYNISGYAANADSVFKFFWGCGGSQRFNNSANWSLTFGKLYNATDGCTAEPYGGAGDVLFRTVATWGSGWAFGNKIKWSELSPNNYVGFGSGSGNQWTLEKISTNYYSDVAGSQVACTWTPSTQYQVYELYRTASTSNSTLNYTSLCQRNTVSGTANFAGYYRPSTNLTIEWAYIRPVNDTNVTIICDGQNCTVTSTVTLTNYPVLLTHSIMGGLLNITDTIYGTPATTDPVFVSPTPSNNSYVNYNVTINVSCNAGNNSLLFFGTSTTPTNLVSNSTLGNYTTGFSSDNVYYYRATCYNTMTGLYSGNTSVYKITYDKTLPTISFDNDTTTPSGSNVTSIYINISISDTNLNRTILNIYNSSNLIRQYNLTMTNFTGFNSSFLPSGASCNGLEAEWTMDSNSSTILYDTTRRFNGTMFNTPTQVDGKVGKGMKFVSGSGEYVVFTNDSFTNLTDFTICTWVNSTSFSGADSVIFEMFHLGSDQYKLGTVASNTAYRGYKVFTNNTASIMGYLVGDEMGISVYTQNGLSTNTWYHLCQVVNYTGDESYMYLNGAIAGTFSIYGRPKSNTTWRCSSQLPGGIYGSSPPTNCIPANDSLYPSLYGRMSLKNSTSPTQVVIGVDPFYFPAGSDFFNGVLDEMRIWSRALKDTDIAEDYNSGSGIALNCSGTPTNATSYVAQVNITGITITGTYYVNATTIDLATNNASTATNTYYVTSNAILNITTIDATTSTNVENFTIDLTDITAGGGAVSYSATGAELLINVVQGHSYSATINAPFYATQTTTIDVLSNPTQYQFNLTYGNSVTVNIYDEDTGLLINETSGYNTTVTFTGDNATYTYTVQNGTYFIYNLTISNYSVLFNNPAYVSRTYYINVSNASTQTLNAYLSTSNVTILFTFRDKDNSQLLESVGLTMYRQIGGVWTPVAVAVSDVTGRLQITASASVQYQFMATKTGYEAKSWTLNPIIFTSYDVYMTSTTQLSLDYDLSTVDVFYSPTSFDTRQDNVWTWRISSVTGDLQSYEYYLETACKNITSYSGTNNYGGTDTTTFNLSCATVMDRVHLYYQYVGSDSAVREFDYYFPIYGTVANNTIMDNRGKTYGMGLLSRVLITVVVTIMVMGAFSMFIGIGGGLGVGLLVLSYLSYIGFIPYWTIIATLLVGVIILIMYNRNG